MREELVFVATCDISGHVRGKGFPNYRRDYERASVGPIAT
jgi:hypothetical protein